jgi:parvulin-like peptidyl-prolyl isomerase
MKRPKKFKRPKLPEALPRPLKRPDAEERFDAALKTAPRITNDTVAEHREEVLSSARKYIYPLQHSKLRVVRTSIALLIIVLVVFLAYCGLALYKFQSTSGFVYDVTRVLPFPVAKVGKSWVSYESYLFELRRNMHYYHTQQQTNFSNKDGKEQLKLLRKQAMAQVVQNAYIKQLAAKNGVSVSQQEVDNEVTLVRNQNRLGNSDRVFKEVLSSFWGWDVNSFKRELRQQLLQQEVVAKLDTGTKKRADSAYKQLQGGADFAAVAAQTSDDIATKGSGGQYPEAITMTNRNFAPAVTDEVFRLQKPGDLSPVINSGYTLEIIKLVDANATARHAAHIQFNLQPITNYTKPLQDKERPHTYIKV